MTLTEVDIDHIEKVVKVQVQTEVKKQLTPFKDKLFRMLDKILKEVRNNREERTALSNRVIDHGKRIERVEQKLDIHTAI